ILIEWVALGHSLKVVPSDSRERFCLCLQLLGLSLLRDYNSDEADKLLARNEDSMLATFMEIGSPGDLQRFDDRQAYHCIALMRRLLAAVGGEDDDRFQRYFDLQYSNQQNQAICGATIDVYGIGSIDGTDKEKMREALSKSE
ncbi:hypothetical protein B0T10DRAFT_371621, partial [Thelonectria olida]